jgi:predicted MFS family arabinose efflux permease
MGVLSTGTVVSAVVFYPTIAWLIVTLGWRTAFVVFGAFVAAATTTLALLYRDPPADPEPGAPRHTPAGGWTLGRAVRTIRLWARCV